jgi:ABC-type tungstate transport system permease subunit
VGYAITDRSTYIAFINFITGPEGQGLIAGYRIGSEPVFFVYGRK